MQDRGDGRTKEDLDEFIDRLLKKIDAKGGPKPISDAEYLSRVRQQISALLSAAAENSPDDEATVKSALRKGLIEPFWGPGVDSMLRKMDRRWPGTASMLQRLIQKEAELEKKVGDA